MSNAIPEAAARIAKRISAEAKTKPRKNAAKTEAQRKRLGVKNPRRTQEVRDRMSFTRYARNHPMEACKLWDELSALGIRDAVKSA